MVLLDTNIIIEWFKANTGILKQIEKIGVQNICISKMTVLEMYIGMLNKREQQKIKKFLNGISQIDIDKETINLSIDLIIKYCLSLLVKCF